MSFTIDVFFYGELAAHIGMNQIEIPLDQSITINDLKKLLTVQFENWSSFSKPIYNVLNQNLVDNEALINIGDVIAFLPNKPLI